MSYFYYAKGPHYRARGYYGLPNLYGYAYYVPDFAYTQNYTVPFYTYPGWFYRPHAYYPRNRYTMENNVVCQATSDPNAYCPKNATLATSNGVKMCSFQDGTMQTAAESMSQCQDPGNWGINRVNNVRIG